MTQRTIPPTAAASTTGTLELWGGVECTVNRVGDQWFDQTPRTGHEHRIGDLDLFAELGVASLRYPALWERISPGKPEDRDFRWTDERLARIRELGMNPILTLCHHGSGPAWTSLIDDGFAPGLAVHAAAVARRYPWVEDWTPVNEVLTTARFSALYGYWYPHTQDEGLFWTALLNEVDATRLSMREIRKVNPRARLIQTDDLGFCHATEPLRCEADYQNERRWMGWDLLCGMVVPGHALWERLVSHGLEDRLRTIADDPCPPDVIGVNHYLASERLLDHRLERHVNRSVADRELGNCAGVPYVDVDAIRTLRSGLVGLPELLRQAAERYGRPVAVTECHNGASREEQVRWFVEVWEGAQALRDEGVDVRAVAAWSLLGSCDWNRMVTRFIGHYETGVYDVRSGAPRPTMLAGVLKDLAAGRKPEAVGLEQPGWWRRDSRFYDAPPPAEGCYDVHRNPDLPGPPLLITGRDGVLVRLLVRACELRALPYAVRSAADARTLETLAPWAVVDGRDWAGVCEEPVAEHGHGFDGAGSWAGFAPPEELVRLCAEAGVRCAVFTAWDLFHEVDERLAALGGERLLLARTDRLYTPWERSRFAVRALEALESGLAVPADADAPWDHAYGPDVVDATLDLLMDGAHGPVALVPSEPWSEAEFLRRLAETADCDPALVGVQGGEGAVWAGEPASLLPPGETTLERFVREARCARALGDAAVSRRRDEPRLEAAE
ncbi:MAG TPA: family 1 glycosylhydrolase [Caulobacteraceae bacterium]|nr:family 1 glycosylhydrolase [Caulobacteraceae bacterium]